MVVIIKLYNYMVYLTYIVNNIAHSRTTCKCKICSGYQDPDRPADPGHHQDRLPPGHIYPEVLPH